MADRVLTLRELNRTTLSRQILLQRSKMSVPAAVEQLVGLQAQQAAAPYIGLWTRIEDFRREELSTLIHAHEIVKATSLRGTLHLCTAKDYIRFRATIQPALTAGWESISKGRKADFDKDTLLKTVQGFIAEKPRTFAEISEMLIRTMPDYDVGAMRYAARTHIPLVQVPINTGWSYPGDPEFTLAEEWLGAPILPEENLRELVFRYLAAFGPATVTDAQTWSYLGLKETFQQLRPELQVYRDERKREMFDLPDMPILAPDTPAPVRFLPEYDNLLLSYQLRTRIIADEHRSRVFLPGLRVRSTILIDGFVRGAWKVEKKKGIATLLIELFEPVTPSDRKVLTEEAERLVCFMEPEAKSFDVKFAEE
jgi:hypothetical protein